MSYIFISYKTDDRAYVSRLAAELRKNGYEVWMDASSLAGSDDWEDEIKSALEQAYAMILVMTSASEKSKWVKREKNHAEGKHCPIIPLWREGDIWFGLNNIQVVDARRATLEDPAPPALYTTLLRYAPHTLDDDLSRRLNSNDATQHRRLLTQLGELAANSYSPQGAAAYEWLQLLAKSSEPALAKRAQLELDDLPSRDSHDPVANNHWKRRIVILMSVVAVTAILIATGLLIGRNDAPSTITPTIDTATSLAVVADNKTATISAGVKATTDGLTQIALAATPNVTLAPSTTPSKPATATAFNANDLAAATRAWRVTQTANRIASYTKTSTLTATVTLTPTDTPNYDKTVAAVVAITDTADALKTIAAYTKTFTPTFTLTFTPTLTLTPTLAPGEERTDKQGIVQVWVPLGCFQMGSDSTKDPSTQGDELPQHEVCLTKGYWLDKFEVTNAAFLKFVEAGGYSNPDYWSKDGLDWLQGQSSKSPANYFGFGDAQQPRVGVSWYEAEAYAKWRSGRLPTEAQWEYAAHSPQSFIYPWGNRYEPGRANINESSIGGKASQKTASVGSYEGDKSWVNAYDLSGNVREWAADWYDSGYYSQKIKDDPIASNNSAKLVIRGGSWNRFNLAARTAYRGYSIATYSANDTGFRIVSDAVQP
ncbi:MAG: SUMF1/EgtB/PvdO family nonheme iron enzyme [Chloroflexota bacterium]